MNKPIQMDIPNRWNKHMALTPEYVMQPGSFYAEPRWKANGITDNRKGWKRKNTPE